MSHPGIEPVTKVFQGLSLYHMSSPGRTAAGSARTNLSKARGAGIILETYLAHSMFLQFKKKKLVTIVAGLVPKEKFRGDLAVNASEMRHRYVAHI